MDMTISVSTNKNFECSEELVNDFNYYAEFDSEDLQLYLKYRQEYSAESSESCRETILSTIREMLEVVGDDAPLYIKLSPEANINIKLVDWMVRNCPVAKLAFDNFVSSKFDFSFSVTTENIPYLHFISFLLLMNDNSLGNIKTRTRISGNWEDLPVLAVSEQIKEIIRGDNITDFSVDVSEYLCGYINLTVEKGVSIKSVFVCSGPENAFANSKFNK